MKRLFVLFLTVAMILPMIVSCNTRNETSSSTTPNVTTTPDVTTPDVTYQTWVVEEYDKVIRDKAMPNDATTSIDLQMARNEKEGFHISFCPSADV